MIIKNAGQFEKCISDDDLFIFAVGYEHRSVFLHKKLLQMSSKCESLAFVLDNYSEFEHASQKVAELSNLQIPYEIIKYGDYLKFQDKVVAQLKTKILSTERLVVHVDYSSMPRSWYCRLPTLFNKVLRENDRAFFWYAEGVYPEIQEAYPSAGIESFSFYSGKPSLRIDNNRIHVLALGYDVIRTQAILSITDPSYLVACYAYNQERDGFLDRLKLSNEPVFSRAAISVPLRVNDFEFMLSKLCDLTNELSAFGDVILIPDGPKPLIFALSLVPDIIRGKHGDGITCLHISRNKEHFQIVDVTALGTVYGFELQVNNKSVKPNHF